jgi:hypothetical protein
MEPSKPPASERRRQVAEGDRERIKFGEMAEWFKAAVLKTAVLERVPGVRIPLSPIRCSTPALALISLFLALCSASCGPRSTLPDALNDQEFWTLIQALSEPAGSFDVSENLVSNEPRFAQSVQQLRPIGGVYVGVGPEQNFSYIARLRPTMAFIVDVRTQNRNLHLLYKALFELSIDRVDFVSRLFSRPRPTALASSASVEDIFSRYRNVSPSPEQFDRNVQLIRERLLMAHGLPLSAVDLESMERAFKAFYTDGPEIQFWGSRVVNSDAVRPSYRELMTMRDLAGQTRSFLADDDGFRFIKGLHSRNRIVPIVGDFGGPAAIRRVGEYVRAHGDVVHAFYGSNVNVYLTNVQRNAFCRNLAGLPVSSSTAFIDNDSVRPLTRRLRACPTKAE